MKMQENKNEKNVSDVVLNLHSKRYVGASYTGEHAISRTSSDYRRRLLRKDQQ